MAPGHLQIEDRMVSDSGHIVEAGSRLLGQRFGTGHTMLQLECDE